MFWRTKTRILTDEIDFLRAQVAQLQNYILMVGPTASTPHLPLHRQIDVGPDVELKFDENDPAFRMYSTELEEDLAYLVEDGQMSQARADELLKEADSAFVEEEA